VSVKTVELLTKNFTWVTPTLSVAVAAKFTGPDILVPETGLVIDTAGFVVSVAAALLTETVSEKTPILPAAS
jgi:hypothetical protein